MQGKLELSKNLSPQEKQWHKTWKQHTSYIRAEMSLKHRQHWYVAHKTMIKQAQWKPENNKDKENPPLTFTKHFICLHRHYLISHIVYLISPYYYYCLMAFINYSDKAHSVLPL